MNFESILAFKHSTRLIEIMLDSNLYYQIEIKIIYKRTHFILDVMTLLLVLKILIFRVRSVRTNLKMVKKKDSQTENFVQWKRLRRTLA